MRRTDFKARFLGTLTASALALTLLPAVLAERGLREQRYERPRVPNVGDRANLVEKLDRLGDFSILLQALNVAELTETVADGGPFTFLAPTDEAFVDLLDELNISAGDLLASPDLTNILLYHVLGGRETAGHLLFSSTAPTLFNEQPVLAVLQDYRLTINGNEVQRANVRASNGLIHVIDGVLLPPQEAISIGSMIDVLRLDGRFSTLLAALEVSGLEGALAGETQLTLFAPTDEAFGILLEQLGVTPEALLSDPSLSDILLYHVLDGRQRALPLLLRGEAETLQGETVSVDFRGGTVRVNDAAVVNPNVNTPNGMVHIIDRVLLP